MVPKENLKNKQKAKIWCLFLKKQKIGATMYFPEGLEDSPLKIKVYWGKNPPSEIISTYCNVRLGIFSLMDSCSVKGWYVSMADDTSISS